MKTQRLGARFVLPILLITLLAATGAQAGERITFDEGQLIIEDQTSDRVVFLDADGLGRMFATGLDEAMAGLDEVFAELEERQLEVRLGDDNMITVETADEAIEVDLDIIFREVGHALETAIEDLDFGMETAGWSRHYRLESADGRHDDSTQDLEKELRELKKELLELQKEMQAKSRQL